VPGRLTSQVVAGARCVAARRVPMMDEPLQIVEVVRQACLEAALRAYTYCMSRRNLFGGKQLRER
jgi:hypothetical protein